MIREHWSLHIQWSFNPLLSFSISFLTEFQIFHFQRSQWRRSKFQANCQIFSGTLLSVFYVRNRVILSIMRWNTSPNCNVKNTPMNKNFVQTITTQLVLRLRHNPKNINIHLLCQITTLHDQVQSSADRSFCFSFSNGFFRHSSFFFLIQTSLLHRRARKTHHYSRIFVTRLSLVFSPSFFPEQFNQRLLFFYSPSLSSRWNQSGRVSRAMRNVSPHWLVE